MIQVDTTETELLLHAYKWFFSLSVTDKLRISIFWPSGMLWENFNPTDIKGLNRNCSYFSIFLLLLVVLWLKVYSLSFRFYFVRPQILTELTKAAAKVSPQTKASKWRWPAVVPSLLHIQSPSLSRILKVGYLELSCEVSTCLGNPKKGDSLQMENLLLPLS